MSGNPFGLTELSHYGQMQRVGGKAAGFINKKFFHPSSLANQEKLWKAQTEHSREQRKQAQLEKQREEEMQVEALRKQMYLQGQSAGSAGSDFLKVAASSGPVEGQQALGDKQVKEQKHAFDEFKKRKNMLKQQALAAAAGPSPDDGSPDGGPEEVPDPASSSSAGARAAEAVVLAKSQYREDFHPNGHESVWGSWFDAAEKKWGFLCCKILARKERCPLAPEEVVSASAGAGGGSGAKRPRNENGEQVRGKRTRKAERRAAAQEAAAAAAASAPNPDADAEAPDVPAPASAGCGEIAPARAGGGQGEAGSAGQLDPSAGSAAAICAETAASA